MRTPFISRKAKRETHHFNKGRKKLSVPPKEVGFLYWVPSREGCDWTAERASAYLDRMDVAESLGKIVGPIFAEASPNADASRTLASLRDTLLPKLISGKIHLRDAEKALEVIE